MKFDEERGLSFLALAAFLEAEITEKISLVRPVSIIVGLDTAVL